MKIQIDDEVQDATPEQIAIIEAIQAAPTVKEQVQTKLDAKAAAAAKLAALGLTEDDLEALGL
jgi:hypothetical protein